MTTKRALALVCLLASACSAPHVEDPDLGPKPKPEEDSGATLPEKEREEEARPDPATPLAPATDALSLARIDRDGAIHTLLVLGENGQEIEAIDLSAALAATPTYPLDLVVAHGFDALAKLAMTGKKEKFPRASLKAPIEEGSVHVCTGINYPDHAAETGQSNVEPFLFPKVATPTSFDTKIERREGDLLDYEVELCVAFARDVATEGDLEKNPIGYVLCNDVSERATQILNLDNDNQASGKGYTDAKSRPGFLPLGPWVVVPKDPGAHLENSTIALSRNGEKRQAASPSKTIWKLDRIVKEALALGADPRFEIGGKPIALLPEGRITRGTLVMTGTPGGVILKAPTAQYKAMKAAQWVASGAFLQMDVETFVKRELVADLREEGAFLLPGETVQAEGTGLGSLRYTIAGSRK